MSARMNTTHKPATDLAIGDSLIFLGQCHRITKFEEYLGPLAHAFTDGARIVHVEGHGAFMTIDLGRMVEVAS
jgi:hypothetical protein